MAKLKHLDESTLDKLSELAALTRETAWERDEGEDLFSPESMREMFESSRREERRKLRAFLRSLSHEQLAEVQALLWLGRDQFAEDARNWDSLMGNALAPDEHVVSYLMEKAELDLNVMKGLEKLKKVIS